MIEFTEGSRMRTNASGSPKTEKPNIIPKGQMTNQTPCNYRTPTKYNVEYLDDKMVIVNGVQYQKVEEPKPQTLLKYFNSFGLIGAEGVCNIVRSWLIDHTVIETEDAEKVTFTILKEQLQTTK
jgi:hypothetical protein